MKQLVVFLCCVLVSLALPVKAASEREIAPQTQALLLELSQAKLSQTQPVLAQLAAQGDARVAFLFETLLNGQLYFYADQQAMVKAVATDNQYQLTEVYTGAALGTVKKSALDKIRVNNTLRVYLRGAIARLQLEHPDPDTRISAVKALYGDLNADTLALLHQLYPLEKNRRVQVAMALAFALADAKSPNENTRLAAVHVLDGALEPEARNALTALVEQDASAEVRKAAKKALNQINEQIELYDFVDQLFFGLSLGSVLLLAAIGLAITFGVMGVINMAHGEMIMLGAYTTYVVQLLMPEAIEYSLLVAVPAAFLVSGAMGVLIERGVIRFLHGRPLETLLATFGISLILQQLVRSVFSPLNRQVASPQWMSGSLEINPVLSLTLNRLYILAFALLVFGLLLLILRNTSLGLNVRAVSQNRDMAKAMGIRTHWVDAMTFGLGSGIAGIAGVALSQLTNVGPNLGQAYIIDSFMVVVFGGVGNLWGTLVAAFSLGVANKFLEPVTGAVLASILVLVFIILFIQKKPKGLFPQKGRAAE